MTFILRLWPFLSYTLFGIILFLNLSYLYKVFLIASILIMGGYIGTYVANRDPINKTMSEMMINFISGIYKLSLEEQENRVTLFFNEVEKLQKTQNKPIKFMYSLGMAEPSLTREEFVHLYALSKELERKNT